MRASLSHQPKGSDMTKQQARAVYLAGAGVMPPSVAPPALNANNNLDRMLHAARFEEWWLYHKPRKASK
jgi:hypothetical protein